MPYTAGSDADLAARNLAQHAPRYLHGQTLVVMNQPGASGAIGTLAVRDAPPDGYRLLLSRIASQVILPATDRKTPYGANEFTFLSVLEINPYCCAAKTDAAFSSMKRADRRNPQRPGKLNFATVGDGTLQNFGPPVSLQSGRLPKDAAIGIPYKGSGDLTVSLLGGQTQFACSNLGALLAHFRSGALRPLMTTTTREPLKDLPDVPTARSLGWPQMESLAAWSALRRTSAPAARRGRALDRRAGEARARSRVARRCRENWRHTRDPPALRKQTSCYASQYELYEQLAAPWACASSADPLDHRSQKRRAIQKCEYG